MVDLHCHILPGIDDGPKTIEESIAMAKSAGLALQDHGRVGQGDDASHLLVFTRM